MNNIPKDDIPTVNTIDSIRTLQKDWNLYGADPIPKEVCDLAENIVQMQTHLPEIFPTALQSIQLEWHGNDNEYLECDVSVNKLNLFFTYKQRNDERELSIDEYKGIKNIVERFYNQSPEEFSL